MATVQKETRTITTEHAPASVLEQAIEATSTRVQSIRATAATFLGVPPNKVCDLLRNIWKSSKGQPALSDNEMFMGLSLVARYGLDPVAREVYVTRDRDGRLLTIVGIDGWIKILDRTEGYDGFEQDFGWSQDGKVLEWVETRIYSKLKSRPTVYRAFSREYGELGGFMAKKIPWHMLRLFSLRHAARLFTPIGASVVTEEEARWMSAYETPDGADQTARVRSKPTATAPSANGGASVDDLAGPSHEHETEPEPTPEPHEPDQPTHEADAGMPAGDRVAAIASWEAAIDACTKAAQVPKVVGKLRGDWLLKEVDVKALCERADEKKAALES